MKEKMQRSLGSKHVHHPCALVVAACRGTHVVTWLDPEAPVEELQGL